MESRIAGAVGPFGGRTGIRILLIRTARAIDHGILDVVEKNMASFTVAANASATFPTSEASPGQAAQQLAHAGTSMAGVIEVCRPWSVWYVQCTAILTRFNMLATLEPTIIIIGMVQCIGNLFDFSYL